MQRKKKEGQSLRDKAYNAIRGKILKLEFQPGEPLLEEKLSSMLKISRTPIREALNELLKEGLVARVEGKGSFVKALTVRDLIDLFQARVALEGCAANLAATNVDKKELEKFEKEFKELKKKKTDHDQIQSDYLLKIGRNFHLFIIKSSNNNKIQEIVLNLYDQIDIGRRYSTKDNLQREIKGIGEHLRIIAALKRGNGALAEEAMREHLNNALSSLISNLGQLKLNV
jgi:DNA-binding GntR family transcriptional regulator